MEEFEDRIRQVETNLRRLFDNISDYFVAEDIEKQADLLRKIADDLANYEYRSKA